METEIKINEYRSFTLPIGFDNDVFVYLNGQLLTGRSDYFIVDNDEKIKVLFVLGAMARYDCIINLVNMKSGRRLNFTFDKSSYTARIIEGVK